MYNLFKFSAPWCGPCKVLGKRLDGFDLCQLVEIDIEESENEPLVEKYKIKSVPTLVLVNGDTEVKRWTGLQDVNKLKDEISAIIS